MSGYDKKSAKAHHDSVVMEITKKLESGLMALRDSDEFKNYLKVMSRFHNYSFNNTLLIAMQKPDATYVAGYTSWKNDFGRQVKKGEKGIKIMAPAPYKKKVEMEVIDPKTQQPQRDENGEIKTDEVEISVSSFKVVTVFDVSSTEGKELPSIGVDELTGRVDRYDVLTGAIEKVAPVPIRFDKIESGAKGYYSPSQKEIVINEGMSQAQSLKTMIHETAHSLLHDNDGIYVDDVAEDEDKSRNTKEVEAESVAYTVCDYYGLDTSEYSFAYVSTWCASLELAELKESMETICKTASKIINEMDEAIEQKAKELEAATKPSVIEKLATIEPRSGSGEKARPAELALA